MYRVYPRIATVRFSEELIALGETSLHICQVLHISESFWQIDSCESVHVFGFAQGPVDGGVAKGGFPDLDLSFLFCPFRDFPGFSGIFPMCPGDCPGIFLIRPFPLSRPIGSACEEQSRKGPQHNPDLSRKKWESPPPGLPSLKQTDLKRTDPRGNLVGTVLLHENLALGEALG